MQSQLQYQYDPIPPEMPPKRVKEITRKPIVAVDEEKRLNPRSRSAKLRVIEKL